MSSNLSDYNSAFKVGAMLRQPDLTVDTRFKTNIEKAGNSFFLYNKFEYTWKKISLRILSALDANVWMLQKNNIEAVYKCNADNELTMSLKVDDFRTSPASLSNFSSYFESLSLDYIRKMN